MDAGSGKSWSRPATATIAIAAAMITAAVVGAVVVATWSGGEAETTSAPPASVPATPAASASVAPAAEPEVIGGDLVWTDEVMLDNDGLELDEFQPRRGGGDLFTGSWEQVSTRDGAKVAAWTESGPPTAAGCLDVVSSSGAASATADTGTLFCVESSDGRPATVKLVSKSPFGAYGWITQATVWQRP